MPRPPCATGSANYFTVPAKPRILDCAPSYKVGKPKDPLNAQWILREQGSGTRSAFQSMLHTIGVDFDDLKIALTLPSNEALRSAVMAGPYVTVVSELVVASYLDAGLLCKANIELPKRAFFLLRHKERYKTKASEALEQVIRQSRT